MSMHYDLGPNHETRLVNPKKMPKSFDKLTVTRLLTNLRRKDRKRRVFGSTKHDYKLNPPVSTSAIGAFEKEL